MFYRYFLNFMQMVFLTNKLLLIDLFDGFLDLQKPWWAQAP